MKEKVILLIMDGWGLAPAWGGNAIEMAQTPNIDNFWRKFPHCELKAAEESVGLPRHEMGNSEVGHLNLGCGQIVYQNLTGINSTISDGSFFSNKVLLNACDHVNKNQSNLHLFGLTSDGGIHSHINHLFALMDLAKKQNVKNVFIHLITDGRDTDPMKTYIFISQIKSKISELGLGKIVTIGGRYFAMDRDKHWDRIKLAYDCIIKGVAPICETPEIATAENYRQNHTDEFITPTVIQTKKEPYLGVNNNDAMIFFNFRADRARQIINSIIRPDFKAFSQKNLTNLYFATFSFLEEYNNNPLIQPVFHLSHVDYSLAKVLSEAKLSQFHIAETEKYAHVTFFFNGGKEDYQPLEEHFMINSPRVATYDLMPEMSAHEIKNKVLSILTSYDFIVCNFANADMVGHTGNTKATIKACEMVDSCVGEITNKALGKDITVLITADHGNAEQMINPETSGPWTEHTTNPVPFILCSNNPELQRPLRTATSSHGLILSDVSPTILNLLNVPQPSEMTGVSLIQKEVTDEI